MDVLAPLLVAAALSCPVPSSQSLIGLWESKSTSMGGIGHVFEFRADGSFVEATSVLVTFQGPPEKIDQTLATARAQGITGDPRQGVKYRHYTGLIAFQRLTDDGDMLFRLPMRSAVGCYALDGSTLTLNPFRGQRVNASLGFKDRSVEMRIGSNPTAAEYERSPFGAWYDVERIDYVPTPRPGAQPPASGTPR